MLVLENCYIRAPQRRPQNTSLYCLWYPEGGGRSESLLESGPIPQTWTHSRQEGAYPLKRRQKHFRWMPAHGPSLKHLQVRWGQSPRWTTQTDKEATRHSSFISGVGRPGQQFLPPFIQDGSNYLEQKPSGDKNRAALSVRYPFLLNMCPVTETMDSLTNQAHITDQSPLNLHASPTLLFPP